MKFIAFAVKAAALLLSVSAYAQSAGSVNVEQGRAMQAKGALMLDVREPSEYAEGHAPGSKLIPLGQLKNRVNEIAAIKDKEIVIICRSGRRSAQAADILSQLGFKSVHNVDGGMNAWEKAKLPVAK